MPCPACCTLGRFGKRRALWSLLSFSVVMRVVSVWKPSTSRSIMNRMCSPMSCGMPSAGRLMFGLSKVGRQPCSSPRLPAFSMRFSTSRTLSRYSSSFRWSLVLMSRRKSCASARTASSTLLSAGEASSLKSRSKASAG
jgi:hypothetical protein